MFIRGTRLAAISLAALALVACEEKKAQRPVEGSDAGAPHPASHGDKNIVDALRAEGSAAAQQGPPETGVFAPGAADKELKLGDPPKFVMGQKGSAPLVQLSPPKPGKRVEGKVEVAIQMGPTSAMPTVELGLATEAAEKGEQPATGPFALLVKATSAKLGADQPGRLPEGADKQIGKVRGSRFKLEVTNGAGHVTAVEPSKDTDESLELIVRAAADAFTFVYQPYPTEPVGKDGFWMVESRESYAGLDAVVYRMYKVLEAKPESVMLEVNVKRLVSPGKLAFPGVPPHHVEQFQDNVTGKIEVLPSDTSNIHADLTDTMIAGLAPEGAAAAQAPQGGHMGLQMQIKTRLAAGR